MNEERRNIPAFETTSLLNKFKTLWLSGIEAKFETRAGQAWGSLHVHPGEHPHQVKHPPTLNQYHRKNDSPCRRRRRERREAARLEANTLVEEAESTEQVANDENDNENAATEEVTVENTNEQVVAEEVSNNQLFLPVEVDDEFCDDENYYDVVDPDIAFTCLQCNFGHFPPKYKDGDTVKKWAICRWHLGVSKCRKCGRTLIGMDQIRAHRQICHGKQIT